MIKIGARIKKSELKAMDSGSTSRIQWIRYLGKLAAKMLKPSWTINAATFPIAYTVPKRLPMSSLGTNRSIIAVNW